MGPALKDVLASLDGDEAFTDWLRSLERTKFEHERWKREYGEAYSPHFPRMGEAMETCVFPAGGLG